MYDPTIIHCTGAAESLAQRQDSTQNGPCVYVYKQPAAQQPVAKGSPYDSQVGIPHQGIPRGFPSHLPIEAHVVHEAYISPSYGLLSHWLELGFYFPDT